MRAEGSARSPAADDSRPATGVDLDTPPGTNITHYLSIVMGTGEGYVGCWHHAPSCLPRPYGAGGVVPPPPIRDTRFDTDLLDPAKLPPGTPVVGSVIHTGFQPVY